jgi:hypothetical protein
MVIVKSDSLYEEFSRTRRGIREESSEKSPRESLGFREESKGKNTGKITIEDPVQVLKAKRWLSPRLPGIGPDSSLNSREKWIPSLFYGSSIG